LLKRCIIPKKREKNPEEYFKGIIREQEKEIRHLQKRIKELKKYDRCQEVERTQDSEDTYTDLPKLQRCDDEACGKGLYKEIELLGHVYGTCTVCGNRKKLR
jgi:hypothetical protein